MADSRGLKAGSPERLWLQKVNKSNQIGFVVGVKDEFWGSAFLLFYDCACWLLHPVGRSGIAFEQ
jgi:hypothetical protein